MVEFRRASIADTVYKDVPKIYGTYTPYDSNELVWGTAKILGRKPSEVVVEVQERCPVRASSEEASQQRDQTLISSQYGNYPVKISLLSPRLLHY